MKPKPRKTAKGRQAAETVPWNNAELDRLIAETIADCNDESECALGFHAAIDDAVALPFETEILGTTVVVESITLTERDEIVAVCRKGSHRQRISLFDLPLPSPPPAGAEWIAAYRHWARVRGGHG